MVLYSHLFKNFPQFVVIYTVKGFSTVNEAEVDVFLEFSFSVILFLFLHSFSYDPVDVGNLISGSKVLPFLNSVCTTGSSWFTYCCSLA